MGFFNYGANILALEKNNMKYGMCAAWAMQSDYDKILILVGSQRETGKVLECGDIIGVSALSDRQENIALNFGTHHTSEFNKFDNNFTYNDEGALLINNAKTNLKCKVKKIIDLENTKDLLIYAYVINAKENEGKFLDYSTMNL